MEGGFMIHIVLDSGKNENSFVIFPTTWAGPHAVVQQCLDWSQIMKRNGLETSQKSLK